MSALRNLQIGKDYKHINAIDCGFTVLQVDQDGPIWNHAVRWFLLRNKQPIGLWMDKIYIEKLNEWIRLGGKHD